MQSNAQKVEVMSNKQRQKKSNKEHKDFRKARRNPAKKQWQGV